MDSRRRFLTKAALLSGAAGLPTLLPSSIRRARAIDPERGSSYLDAAHVVILMQENRSFDHCFGSLQGVRGFNDPRAISLPNGNPVWLQSNAAGETYAPFRLNMHDTRATWMGSLPHGWTDQVDAGNRGKHDGWLDAKRPGRPEYAHMPLTLGHYTRADLPFYYALADAFTVCDQNFCSALTGTSPNRLFLWTGTTRENSSAPARVRNSEIDYKLPASWKTFPERLEAHGVDWKVYQNELSIEVGLGDEEADWLANFTDNPLEFFAQYDVHARTKGSVLAPARKRLHERAFTTNAGDPDFHRLTPLRYGEGAQAREVKVPRGDVLFQFRKDVARGALPTVSWLVAPQKFSDHPDSPWYGSWYVSEALDILTRNPAVWQKTIFILCYDENDGYFDHVPPFSPPQPGQPNTGLASTGLDCAAEFVSLQEELQRQPAKHARAGAIGLGYRVPLVIASPWSRGGRVNSQVFDHTSILQFLEKFLGQKTGRAIKETNISAWRRTVCGDLTSVFTTDRRELIAGPAPLGKDASIEQIHAAQDKPLPPPMVPLTAAQLRRARHPATAAALWPAQEKGVRPASALPYEHYIDGGLGPDRKSFRLSLRAGRAFWGAQSAGAPFLAYANRDAPPRAYAVAAGEALEDSNWPLAGFPGGLYRLRVHGPNGFFRQFSGSAHDPALRVLCGYQRAGARPTGNLELQIENTDRRAHVVIVRDETYRTRPRRLTVRAGASVTLVRDLSRSHGWYDLALTTPTAPRFSQRFAGHVETGNPSFTDPAMGGVSWKACKKLWIRTKLLLLTFMMSPILQSLSRK